MTQNSFENIISIIAQCFQHRAISIWNLEHKCVFATDLYKKFLQMEDVVGKEMGEFNAYLQKHQGEFRDKITYRVVKNKVPVLAYYICPNIGADNYGLHSIVITPLLSENEEVIGVISDAQIIENTVIFQHLFRSILPQGYNIIISSKTIYPHKITRREHIILFLLLIGKSHKEIAAILSDIYEKEILPNSISSMISKQIYTKFDTHSNSDLILQAYQMGILYNIPHELVNALPMVLFTLENPTYEVLVNITPQRL